MSREVPKEVIELAERLCNKKSGFKRYPMAAIIYKGRKPTIISTGVNRHLFIGTDIKRKVYSIHAERDAISGCSKQDLWGASIFIFRKNSLLAKPCIKCMNLIMSTGISHIHWSNGGGI
jgi:deoxycytidylate deaminase